MRVTDTLFDAIGAAIACDCIICASTVRNLRGATKNWRAQPKGKAGEWHRGIYRINWKAAAKQLLVLAESPEKHLKGAPNAYSTTSSLEE